MKQTCRDIEYSEDMLAACTVVVCELKAKPGLPDGMSRISPNSKLYSEKFPKHDLT